MAETTQILGIDSNVKKFGFAKIEGNAFSSPVIYEKNIISATSTVEQGSKTVRADGIAKMIIKGSKNRILETTVLKVSKDYAELALGFKSTLNGGLTDTGTNTSHCVFFMTEETSESNVSTDVIHYFYNVSASTPSEEFVQNEDEVSVSQLVIPYSAIPSDIALDKDGVRCAYFKLVRDETNKTLFDQYKTKVILPTDTISPSK